MLEVSFDRVDTHHELVGDFRRFDPSFGQRPNPQLGIGQRVHVDPATALPSMSELQLVAGFLRPALGAASVRELQGPAQERPGRNVLARSPQLRAEPIAEARLQQRHPALRRETDRLIQETAARRWITLLGGRRTTDKKNHAWKPAWEPVRPRLERLEQVSRVLEAATVAVGSDGVARPGNDARLEDVQLT